MSVAELPHVDEHVAIIEAGVEDVWPGLIETLDRFLSRIGTAGFARILGCADRAASGPRPLAEGSTVPGFRVVAAIPGTSLVLAGHHRFSSYALIFRLEPVGSGQSRLRAETRAAFPGMAGRFYRIMIIGTGGHVVAVRRVLSTVRRQSQSNVATRASSDRS